MYIRTTFKSKMLMRAVDVHVFLPFHDGYPDTPAPFPTLYFLPGYSASAEEIATCLPMRQMSAKYGIAIVIPDGENSFYSDHPERATLHGSYVEKELVETTRALFPQLSHKREDTYIGGISMGGYGSLINGLRYSDTFGKIAMLSPALEMHRRQRENPELCPIPLGELEGTIGKETEIEGTYKDYLYASKKAIAENKLPEIFLGCGRQDELVIAASRRYCKAMEELGHPITYYEKDGLHDHTFWKQALTPLCEFLTGKGGK